jgi:hypothetical protein
LPVSGDAMRVSSFVVVAAMLSQSPRPGQTGERMNDE